MGDRGTTLRILLEIPEIIEGHIIEIIKKKKK